MKRAVPSIPSILLNFFHIIHIVLDRASVYWFFMWVVLLTFSVTRWPTEWLGESGIGTGDWDFGPAHSCKSMNSVEFCFALNWVEYWVAFGSVELSRVLNYVLGWVDLSRILSRVLGWVESSRVLSRVLSCFLGLVELSRVLRGIFWVELHWVEYWVVFCLSCTESSWIESIIELWFGLSWIESSLELSFELYWTELSFKVNWSELSFQLSCTILGVIGVRCDVYGIWWVSWVWGLICLLGVIGVTVWLV